VVGWTAQFIFAIAQVAEFHLATVEFSFTDNTQTLVIERSPVSNSIFHTKNGQPRVEFEMSDHNAKSSLLLASTSTIRPLDDCVVG